MYIPISWKNISLLMLFMASCSLVSLSRERETNYFFVHGDIPTNRIDIIYKIIRENILIPTSSEEKITVRIDPRLRKAHYEGKAYARHIALASYNDNVFIHEITHYLWEIRSWKLKPGLEAEKAQLKRKNPLIKEELLNHYLIYTVIVPRVEALLREKPPIQ